MVNEYKEIEKFGTEAYEWYKGILLKERLLHGKILELFLESIKPLGEYSKDTNYRQLALLTLATRLFNDSEGAIHLLLRGLPSQAQMIIRNIIESIMLFRLFLNDANLAKRWIMDLAEFQPGDVNAKLLRMGVNAKEYGFYGILSHQGHSNLLGSISNIQEKQVDEGMLSTFHFGSSRTPTTINFVQHSFRIWFFLFDLLLTEPLSEYYSQHSESVVYSAWAEKVSKVRLELEALTIEAINRSRDDMSEVDKRIKELVSGKMRLKEFKQRFSGSTDETTKIE